MLIFNSVTNTKGQKQADSQENWQYIVDSLKITENKHSVQLYSAFEPISDSCERNDSNVKYMTALVIDYDNENGKHPTHYTDVIEQLREYEFYIHSTHSNMMNKGGKIRPRFRLIMPFSRPVAPEEWAYVWQGYKNMMDGDLNIDISCKSKSRSYYIPSCPASLENQAFKHINDTDERIDPEYLMGFVKDHEKAAFKEDRFISNTSNDIDEVRNALKFIDSDDYAQWIHIGMALKEEFGENQGFDIFDEWSKTPNQAQINAGCSVNPKYSGSLDTKNKFNTFKSTGITINTVFYFAGLNGWTRESYGDESSEFLNHMLQNNNLIKRLAAKKKGGDKAIKELEQEEILEEEKPKTVNLTVDYKAPGIVGEIAEWITATAVKPQPALSLAAALTGVGVAMGRKYASETDLRTNIYTLCLSNSGTGKDHPRKAIKKILVQAGLEDRIGESAATSGTAVLKSLLRGNGIRAFFMDEIGYLLTAVNNKNSSSAEKEFIKNTLELFSSANDLFIGKAMANEDSVRIDQPCMGLMGSTVKHKLFQGITSSEAADGFLSRFLIFEGDPDAKRNKKNGVIDPPSHIIETLKKIALKEKLTTVPYTDEAEALFDEFTDYCDLETRKEIKDRSGLEALWTRGVEHAIKIALVCHNVESGEIDLKVAKWAINFVKTMIKNEIIELKENLYDNEAEKDIKTVLRIIKNYDGWIPLSIISEQTLTMGKKRNDILKDLVESEYIETKQESNGKGRPKLYYRHVK